MFASGERLRTPATLPLGGKHLKKDPRFPFYPKGKMDGIVWF
jgi:hypothetical protein